MATIIPSFELIYKQKVQPEEGELHLLKFLDKELDDSFEVFFNPLMNGDRPDIVIMRKGQGVMIIEVKDWNLNLYELNSKKQWKLKSDTFTIKSPISQVLKYKSNLYDLHIENLLESKIKDIRSFNMVSCVVYFHNAYSNQINEVLVNSFKFDFKYQNFLKYNIDLLGRDNLNEFDFKALLQKRYLISDRPSIFFTDSYYESFKRFLKPPIHLKEHGKDIRYSRKQLEIIYDATRKQQRIKGVVGSGKTSVLAARAVQAHKRTQGLVLILTYNITLKNYIHDKLSDVREDFPWGNFVISNYHLFINSELNNLGIPVEVPENFQSLSEEEREEYFESKYYSNVALFEQNKNGIKPYDVILVDEIQDYKRGWMDILKNCFLAPDGEYVLFGDVKQNIYNNATSSKDVNTNVRGVTELKDCFRSDFKIKDLAIHYQQEVFKDKYEIDSFNKPASDMEIVFERNQQGSLNYIHLSSTDNVKSLYTIIHENAINKDVPPNDITVLGHSIALLKKFDTYYRYSSNEKTNTMFETSELVYLMGFNYLQSKTPKWLQDGLTLVKVFSKGQEKRGFQDLSVLFTIHDLILEYGNQFDDKLNHHCVKFRTSVDKYMEYYKTHEEDIKAFKREIGGNRQKSNLEMIRKNKKLHFFMNSGTVKVSTIHSFKGWESETLFLIIEKRIPNMEMTFDELIYTGITRSRANLVLINFGNEEYHKKLEALIAKVK